MNTSDHVVIVTDQTDMPRWPSLYELALKHERILHAIYRGKPMTPSAAGGGEGGQE